MPDTVITSHAWEHDWILLSPELMRDINPDTVIFRPVSLIAMAISRAGTVIASHAWEHDWILLSSLCLKLGKQKLLRDGSLLSLK